MRRLTELLVLAMTLFTSMTLPGCALRVAQPVTLPRTQTFTLRSTDGLEYTLYVSVPREAQQDPLRRFPVIYLLDADYSFAVVRNVVEHLADRRGLPPAIIVGIGYPKGLEGEDWLRRYRLQRTRDYTPTASSVGYPDGVQAVSGGGQKFLQFIERELVPFIDARVATTTDRTLVGHSYGGLFALYAVLTRPDLFTRVVSVPEPLVRSSLVGAPRVTPCTVHQRAVPRRWQPRARPRRRRHRQRRRSLRAQPDPALPGGSHQLVHLRCRHPRFGLPRRGRTRAAQCLSRPPRD